MLNAARYSVADAAAALVCTWVKLFNLTRLTEKENRWGRPLGHTKIAVQEWRTFDVPVLGFCTDIPNAL